MRWCSSTSPSAHTRACFSACSTSPLGHAERRTACAMSPPPWTGKRATYRSRTATVGVGGKPVGQPREAEVGAVEAAQDGGVVAPVVDGHQPVGALGVLPQPAGEPLLEGLQLGLGEHRLGEVADPGGGAVGALDLVVDHGGAAVAGQLRQLVGVVAAGAPFGGG